MIIYRDAMTDLREVEVVEIDWDGRVIWINVDGVCALRITEYKILKIKGEDDASGSSSKL